MFPPPKLVTSKLFISSSDFQNQKSQNFSKHTSPSFRNRYSGVTLLRGSRDMARYMKQVQRKSQKRYSRVTTPLPIWFSLISEYQAPWLSCQFNRPRSLSFTQTTCYSSRSSGRGTPSQIMYMAQKTLGLASKPENCVYSKIRNFAIFGST